MTFGILITARLKSKRLKKKIIKKINNKTLIGYLIQRLKLKFNKKKIILITSKSNQDKKLIKICREENINSFRGEPKDVLKRIYDASIRFKLKNVISITADNPLVDTDLAQKLIKLHIKKKYDLTIIKGLPIGLFCYALKVSAVKRAINLKNTKDTETWVSYFTDLKKFKIGYLKIKFKNKFSDKIRLTIDTKEDLFFVRKVLKFCKTNQPKTDEILRVIKYNPNLIKINSMIKQKTVSKPKFK